MDYNLQWRVWSWLRMNASGRLNTCKSRGNREELAFPLTTGARVRNTYATYLLLKDSPEKFGLILHNTTRSHDLMVKGYGKRWACVLLVCWWGNGSPRLRSVAGLRGWSATLGLRYGPDSYGRQQWGILRNGRKSDAAMPREGWRRYAL